MSEFTRLLSRAEQGDESAAEELIPLVYTELRQIAIAKMRGESPGHTLQATALVHEAWLRLGADAQPQWKNRAHFFGAAAEAMRRILVDRARRKRAARRGGDQVRVDFDELELPFPVKDEELLDVDDALEKLALIDPRKAELVKLRYFVGLTYEEAASVLEISVPTAKKWWAFSRAWMLAEVRGEHPD